MSKYFFIIACLLFITSAVLLLLNHAGFALRIITYSFPAISLGTIFYIRETRE